MTKLVLEQRTISIVVIIALAVVLSDEMQERDVMKLINRTPNISWNIITITHSSVIYGKHALITNDDFILILQISTLFYMFSHLQMCLQKLKFSFQIRLTLYWNKKFICPYRNH